MIAPSDVIGIAPEFGTTAPAITSAEIQVAINDALLELSTEAWGAKLDLATKYLAAHKLASTHPELSQIKPRIFETPGSSDAGELGTTRFGIYFYGLQKQLSRLVVAGGGVPSGFPFCC